jgi:stage V sporulation protein B
MLFPSLSRMSLEHHLGEMLQLYNEAIKKLLLIITFMVAFAGSFATAVMAVFGHEFKQADTVLLLLLLGLIPEVFSLASSVLLQAFNRPELVSLYCFLGAITNVVLNLLLIPVLGIKGSAIANTSGLMAMAIFLYYHACRVAQRPVIDKTHALSYLNILLVGGIIFVAGKALLGFVHSFVGLLIFFVLLAVLYLFLLQVFKLYTIKPKLSLVKCP